MTLYLTDNTSPAEIERAKSSGFVHAVKYYPAGATTNSDSGVTALDRVYPALAAMERAGLVLSLHGEVTDAAVDMFDRERVFVDTLLARIVRDFPGLRIVLEHITTREAAAFVREAPDADRRDDHAAAPALVAQRAVRGRHPAALLLPPGPEARDASRGARRGRDVGQSAVLPGHRFRAARAAHEGERVRLRRMLFGPRGARTLRGSVRRRGRARPARGLREPVRRGLLRAAAEHGPDHARADAVDRPRRVSVRRGHDRAAARGRDRCAGASPESPDIRAGQQLARQDRAMRLLCDRLKSFSEADRPSARRKRKPIRFVPPCASRSGLRGVRLMSATAADRRAGPAGPSVPARRCLTAYQRYRYPPYKGCTLRAPGGGTAAAARHAHASSTKAAAARAVGGGEIERAACASALSPAVRRAPPRCSASVVAGHAVTATKRAVGTPHPGDTSTCKCIARATRPAIPSPSRVLAHGADGACQAVDLPPTPGAARARRLPAVPGQRAAGTFTRTKGTSVRCSAVKSWYEASQTVAARRGASRAGRGKSGLRRAGCRVTPGRHKSPLARPTKARNRATETSRFPSNGSG